ncbi:D-erythronate dehydrogenase [Paraburkholderia rhizosphaerae]|uniref:Nucleoside-diphosphate-sugar epimerase n=1 Tax=Paraburkholderia rhizosphaerae TaxID=480658 RepID=A0A4R8LZU3_9BURK|nr:D-erythronate dehydrogenase [Paraburkholderia rhizosphaerae]TDY52280.1 nucleoside-diphosphate-sugar epimerase [Paraburkholderia rhizosphaerae]
MKVLVTGAAGFLGRRLIGALLARGELTGPAGKPVAIDRIDAFDVVPLEGINDPRVRAVTGDIADPAQIEQLVDADTLAVFHLAAIVSGQAEQEFELGMRINFDATRMLFERIRTLGTQARFVMTSSVAVFGGAMPATVPDSQVWAPQSSYGTQKALSDLMLADYSRRGYIDGRSLRMPTIVVRPGKPNRAASSFASGIIREPINGVESVCPVAPETILWLMSPDRAIDNLLHGYELPKEKLTQGRVINMPGLSVSVENMLASLRRIAGDTVANRVRMERDPAVERIVNSWPGNFSADYARSLGFVFDADFDSVVHAFIRDNAAQPA